ncbi:hypothetical protein FZEAL_9545 [Fusarium zealandicum]|uniref:Cation efflux protein cytoplasmic domain-containing protein n=1 Tax=Fusarium zealandicum TaxID=1053134 RepID=A0A8H4UAW7_9HYPO|nr:hypothetical protein FZEAL_9545 [Fusarium zealandicum]
MFSVSLVLIVMSARNLAASSEEETNKFHLTSVIAVSRDHRNDLSINGLGILILVGGAKLKWWIDPMGAIILSFLIADLWMHTAYDEFQLMIGVTADKETLQLITYISMTHSSIIEKDDTVRAYYIGPRLVAEVDIVIDRKERLEVAHDIVENLQIKLEKLSIIECAFVYVDYETSRRPVS